MATGFFFHSQRNFRNFQNVTKKKKKYGFLLDLSQMIQIYDEYVWPTIFMNANNTKMLKPHPCNTKGQYKLLMRKLCETQDKNIMVKILPISLNILSQAK